MTRVLFVSENLSPNSHTIDMLDGVLEVAELTITVDYYKEYNNLGKSKFELHLLKLIDENNIDIVIINLGTTYILDPYFLCDLSNHKKINVVISFPDPEHNFDDNDRYYAQCADICWLFSSGVESLFNTYGYSTFVGQPYSTKRYPYSSLPKIYDVSFVGGIDRADRRVYLDYLSDNKIEVMLAGYGTEIGLVTVPEKNRIISSSYIHIDFSKVENKKLNIFRRVKQQKGRTIEALLLGTFVLAEECPSLRTIFLESEVDFFNSPEELLAKIRFYLANKSLIEKMSKSAHIKALSYETASVFRRILSKIYSNQNAKKFFITDEIFEYKYLSQRYYYFSKFFFLLRFRSSYDEFKYILSSNKISIKNIFVDIPRGIKHAFDFYLFALKK